MPERALSLSVATDGTCGLAVHTDLKDVTLDGKPLAEIDAKEREHWPLGAQLAVGNTLLELVRYTRRTRR
ncbi:hypothetical protein NKH77_23415 [Streptomyces sp. M19]